MKKEIVIPKGGAKPLAPYSPAIKTDQFVFTSGQIGIDPETGRLIPGGVKAETRQALENLQSVLLAAGASSQSGARGIAYIKEIQDYSLVNEVYGEFFKEDPPARSIVQGELPASAYVEFDAVAII